MSGSELKTTIDAAMADRMLQGFGFHLLQGVSLHLGPGTAIESPCSLLAGATSPRGFVWGAFSYSSSRITRFVGTVGRYCSIAPQVSLGDWEHPTDTLTTSIVTFDHHFPLGAYVKKKNPNVLHIPLSNPKPICLEHDVWIGKGSFIKSGVRIGTGAIVGTNAVVTKDVPPYAIVVGVPAQVKRFRFSDLLVEKLLASEWWQYSWMDIGDIDTRDPSAACDAIAERRQSGRLHPFKPIPLNIAQIQAALDGSEASLI